MTLWLPRRPATSLLLACCVCAAACARQPEFDLIVRGGTIDEGTGAVEGVRRADVGIKGDRIAEIGNLANRRASAVVDASGKLVVPGFIDAHGQSGVTLLGDGYGESHLRQGITTEIIGDNSPAFWTSGTADASALQRLGLAFDWNGIDGYFGKLESRGTAINVGTLVPSALAPPGASAAAFVDEAMRAGALGVADDAADVTGRKVLASVAGRYNGVFVSRLRSGVPVPEEADAIVSAAAEGRPTVAIVDLMLVDPPAADSVAQVVRRLVLGNQNGLRPFGTIAPFAASAGGSDAPAREALKYGAISIGTNTAAATAATAPPTTSPAAFGAFPRLLGQWVREEHVLELREAVRRITSQAASIFQLQQRGMIRENYFADLFVFDPQTIRDLGETKRVPRGHRLCHRQWGRDADAGRVDRLACGSPAAPRGSSTAVNRGVSPLRSPPHARRGRTSSFASRTRVPAPGGCGRPWCS
jgi:amidohydrolase family protein